MGLFKRKKDGHSAPAGDALYYASDVHGSDICWRKFLGAARHYGISNLVMGGDLTGKVVVPIATGPDCGFSAEFLGERRTGRGDAALAELCGAVRYNGMYPWPAPAEEIARYAGDDAARDELFDRLMVEALREWIALADDRGETYGLNVYVMPGNDDPWSCDPVIEAARHVTACDDRIVTLGEHEMLSCAYANPTPWDSPRELDEDALYERIDRLASQLERPQQAIFNLHVPPYDTGLDTAREVDEDLTLVLRNDQPHEIPVGSRAVRELIERYQPLLSLHGHIHESRGEARLGRTLALNSGSEYNSGQIHGVVVQLAPDQVLSHRFVVG